MALELEIERPSGATVDYHRVGQIINRRDGSPYQVTVDSYVSVATRMAGKAADGQSRSYLIPRDDLVDGAGEVLADPTCAAVYEWLKLHGDWAGAVDV